MSSNAEKYYWRRQVTKLFDAYLILCGLAFNAFALLAVLNTAGSLDPNKEERLNRRARVEMENEDLCTKHMAGKTMDLNSTQDFSIRVFDRDDVKLTYKYRRTYGYTKDGHSIEAVEVGPMNLYFIVNDDRKIERCLPGYGPERSHQLDCLTAAGEYQSNGECVLAVNQSSDCQMMKGSLNDGLCRVPAGAHILRAVTSAGKPQVCHGPECRTTRAVPSKDI